MNSDLSLKELKDIEKNIIKGIFLKDNFANANTLVAFDIAYREKTCKCFAVVMDINTLKEIEIKSIENKETIPYSPKLSAFREGPAIIEAYRSLQAKPDILLVKGNGAVSKNSVGLASYVGVLLNKPCIGVSKEVQFFRLDEDRIISDNEVKGIAIKTKEFANPIYISPGHNISIETSVNIVKKLVVQGCKLPLPLHLAHKYVNKFKKK